MTAGDVQIEAGKMTLDRTSLDFVSFLGDWKK